ncbi:MAG: FAD-binding oxidoreductase [Alteromonadaceae bacterium]|nr:FAD-binding oxidoreductase [Alteromonadaceae bacterium]
MNKLHSQILHVISNQATLITNREKCAPYLQGTEGFSSFNDKKRCIDSVVIAGNTDDITALIKLANVVSNNEELKFSVHPISSGRNWGYGTSQPPTTKNKTVLLDLSALKQIEFDEELGLVTLQPGITQQELSDYLIKLGDNYMVPVTGAGPDCSIVGNAIERGYGITQYTDHFGAVTAIKGLWANGIQYQSALFELDQSKEKFVDKTYKWGVGPYLDGLFTQSNFGIVTEMTIRLSARKPAFVSFLIKLKSDELLEAAIPLIQRVLRDYEGIVGSINLMDKRRMLSMFADNPNVNDHQIMSDIQVQTQTKNLKIPSWTIVGSISGSKNIVKVTKNEIKNIFKQIPNQAIFSDDPVISMGNKVISLLPEGILNRSAMLKKVKLQLGSFNKAKEVMQGKPNRVALKLAYWRHHKGANSFEGKVLSPGKDKCGLLWYAPLVMMKANAMCEYVEFVRKICPLFNIEPFITFTNLRHDCVDSTVPILFDLSNPIAVKDAHNCLKELVTEGLKLGYVPYRLNIDQQQWLLDKESDFWQTVNQIKSKLDPNNILSPGRYNPR